MSAFDEVRALDRDPFAALSVVAEIASRLAADHGRYEGVELVLANVAAVGAEADGMISFLRHPRDEPKAWEPTRLSFEGELPRLIVEPLPPGSKAFAKTIAKRLRAFFTQELRSLDPRHRRWVDKALEPTLVSALASAELFAVRSSRTLTCCGGQLHLARTGEQWVAIHEFMYC